MRLKCFPALSLAAGRGTGNLATLVAKQLYGVWEPKKMIRHLCLLGLLFLPASIASAHPGHGSDGGSHAALHYLSDPLHLGLLASVLLLSLIVAYAWRSRSLQSRPE